MDDRQRQFAQLATALNQYANSNTGNGDRNSRDRSATDGRSSTGSTSSGSSNSSGNAAAAALWGDLSRAFQFNYSSWPPSSHQGGSEFHRYGYGGFNEGPQDNRVPMEGRTEGRRVPSKGETKATPPLPPGLSPNVVPMGSALASLQQLVGIPNDEVYRTILAQQYAAAAFSALPPNTHPSLSPIPHTPTSHSAISPNQLHGSPIPQRHPQQQQQQQQQQLQYQMQQQQLQQQQLQQQQLQQQQLQRARQPKSSPPLPLLSTVGSHTMPPAPSPDNGSLNGEYLEPMGRGPQSQLSPMSRKEGRMGLELSYTDPIQQGSMRQSPISGPPKSSSVSPGDHLAPHHDSGREQHHYNPNPMFEGDKPHHTHPGGDHGTRSGSESEGDQRIRHKRKQDQPRRQTVIYPNTGHPSGQHGGHPGAHPGGHSEVHHGQHPDLSLPSGGAPLPNTCHPSSVSAESSSDDSQGYDSLLNRSHTNAPSPGETLRNNSPMVPLDGGSSGSQLPISQAMSHALSHPFLAAHLNAFVPSVSKSDPSQFSSGEYNVVPSPSQHVQNKETNSRYEGVSSHKPHNSGPYPPTSQYSKVSGEAKGPMGGYYHSEHRPTDKEFHQHSQSPQLSGVETKSHNYGDDGGGRVKEPMESSYEDKMPDMNYANDTVLHYDNRTQKDYGYVRVDEHTCDKGTHDPGFDRDMHPCEKGPPESGYVRCEVYSSGEVYSSEKGPESDYGRGEVHPCERRIPESGSSYNQPPSNAGFQPMTEEKNLEQNLINHHIEVLPQQLGGNPQLSGSPCPEGTSLSPKSTSESLVTNASSNVLPSRGFERVQFYDNPSNLEVPRPPPPDSSSQPSLTNPSPVDPIEKREDRPQDSNKGGQLSPQAVANVSDLEREQNPKPDMTLVNGTSSPVSLKGPQGRVTPNEVLNGHLETVVSPGRKQKKKAECENIESAPPASPQEVCEKRRTRQKRPVSYVEDETDPVLETREDYSPLLSPARKRGRKGREETPPKLRGYSNTNCFTENPHRGHNSMEEGVLDSSSGGNHMLQLTHKIYTNVREPLHIDTNLRPAGAHPSTPTIHSPDIYDFNDTEADVSSRGGKGKKGRKRGSPKKQGRTTPEYLRPSLSPRVKEGGAWSPRSPKFFSMRSSYEISCDVHQRFGNPDDLKSHKDPSEHPAPGNVAQPDIPTLTPIFLGNPIPTAVLVDEVEAQLAALHKETPPRGDQSSPPTPKVEIQKEPDPTPLPVHKPMLSVVPLEQLTYEGLKNRSKSPTDPLLLDSGLSALSMVNPHNSSSQENPMDGQINPQTNPLDVTHDTDTTGNQRMGLKPTDKDCVEVDIPDPLSLNPLPSQAGVVYSGKHGYRGRRGPRCRGRGKEPPLSFLGSEYPENEQHSSKSAPTGTKSPPKECGGPVDPLVIERVVASIPESEQSVHVVSVSDTPVPVLSNRGNRHRKRGVGRGRASVVTPVESEPASNPKPHPQSEEVSNGTSNPPQEERIPVESSPRLRRSRRSVNQRIDADSSPNCSPTRFGHPPGERDGPEELFDNRVPPSHETLQCDMAPSSSTTTTAGTSISSSVPQGAATPEGGCQPSEGAETLEDIAKFLEATAPPESKSPSREAPASDIGLLTPSLNNSGGSSSLELPTPSSSGEASYREGRPKRVSRPPPQMGDGEVNDLLLLLNMEEEESEDEDYIPLGGKDGIEDEEEDGGEDSEEVKEGDEEDSDLDLTIGSGASSLPRKKPLRPPAKKRVPTKKGIMHSRRGGKATSRRGDDGDKRKEDLKRKSDDPRDRRGPILRISRGEDVDFVLNAPSREEEDPERTKRLATSFYLDLEVGSAARSKVGFSSTLHAHYDAFNKDLGWFCALCKNYSHHRTLGDLFGPFYIKGLALKKKNFPEVVDGQIPDMTLSPVHPSAHSSKHKSKRTPRHETQVEEARRLEVGACSPPSRFVPSATPARMLGRGGATPNSPRTPWQSPLRGSSSSHSSFTQPSVAPASKGSPAPTTTKGESSGGESNPQGTECWLHESCTLWTSGITAVNSKLCGLEEAVLSAQESICIHCGEAGATVCCLGRGCALLVHVPCSKVLLWTLNADTFQSFCPKHVVPVNKNSSSSRKGGHSSHHSKKS